ncbi:hypothetical protein B0H14DRAFT_3467883 [Mycena olivaceomarginata]|nr:hypothetical protein B0H14DRAFT_3467883 [Mycena olivaceomarginata]
MSDIEKPLCKVPVFLGGRWHPQAACSELSAAFRHVATVVIAADTCSSGMDAELVKNTRVWGTALVPKILEAYCAAETGTYWIARDLRWIRDVADDLVQSQAALITSVHLGPAIVFDCRNKPVVRYGDSLKAPFAFVAIWLITLDFCYHNHAPGAKPKTLRRNSPRTLLWSLDAAVCGLMLAI